MKRHRIDVRGNPIAREPLFPVVRFVLIGVLMFAGVFAGAGQIRADATPIATPEPESMEVCR